MSQISVKLDALRDGVEKIKNAEAAVVAFVNGVPTLIRAAVDAALVAGAVPEELAAFDELNHRLVQEAEQIAGDVMAGTSPPPPTDGQTPEPDPTP